MFLRRVRCASVHETELGPVHTKAFCPLDASKRFFIAVEYQKSTVLLSMPVILEDAYNGHKPCVDRSWGISKLKCSLPHLRIMNGRQREPPRSRRTLVRALVKEGFVNNLDGLLRFRVPPRFFRKNSGLLSDEAACQVPKISFARFMFSMTATPKGHRSSQLPHWIQSEP